MKHFLLVYSRTQGKLLGEPREYSDEAREEAWAERSRLETVYRENPDIEVVLLGSQSLESIQRTHGRYFLTTAQLATRASDAMNDVIRAYGAAK